MNKIFSILIMSATIQGCSIMPYEEKSSCQYNELGKCLPIDKAYLEAITGIDQGGNQVNGDDTIIDSQIITTRSINNKTKYNYEKLLYQKQTNLIKPSTMPLLKPAVVRKVLIMSYKNQDSDIWYEPRSIYYIEKQPQWSLEKIQPNQKQQKLLNLYQ